MLIEDSSLESNYGWSIPVDARVGLCYNSETLVLVWEKNLVEGELNGELFTGSIPTYILMSLVHDITMLLLP